MRIGLPHLTEGGRMNYREDPMMIRVICGLAGAAVLLVALTWHQILPLHWQSSISSVSGTVTFAGIMLGVYILFFGLTGDWLPRLRKREKQN